jgi:hypothetical protein
VSGCLVILAVVIWAAVGAADGIGDALAGGLGSAVGGWRRHEVHVDQFKPEAGDPLQEPGEGCLIGQLSAKGRRARADGDLAVVEFRAQCSARLAAERDLVRL